MDKLAIRTNWGGCFYTDMVDDPSRECKVNFCEEGATYEPINPISPVIISVARKTFVI